MSEDKAKFKVEMSEKEKALEATLKEIEKECGAGSILRYGDGPPMKVEVHPTGLINLDLALGVRGIPKGRIMEFYGAESGGKTTLALTIAGAIQAKGGNVAFVDAEHAFDPNWASLCGVDVDKILFSQPDHAEHALSVVEFLVKGGAVDLIIVDSVAALIPKVELEGEMGDVTVALQARLMSKALRRLTPITGKSKSIIIFINQLRENIGSFGWGPKESTPGGRALKFYSSIRLDVRRFGAIKTGDKHIGNQVKIKVVKNKVAPPFKEVMIDLYFANGISKESAIIDIGLQNGIVVKKGAYLSFKKSATEEIAIGSSKLNSIERLINEPALKEEILQNIFQVLNWL